MAEASSKPQMRIDGGIPNLTHAPHQYKKVRTIGIGTFGSAILVQRLNDGKHMVLKKVNVSSTPAAESTNALNEVRVLSQFHHPNIIAHHESFIRDGYLNIVMDYASEGDLHKHILAAVENGSKPFPESQVMRWFAQVVSAVRHVHSRAVLHRDISSKNIFLMDNGLVKLGDFGVAKILQNRNELANTMVGTPSYLSPELCEDEAYNSKSDIWAIGCLLYETCAFKHAFVGTSVPGLCMKIMKGKYSPLPSCYSKDVHNLVRDILQKSPAARPSAEALYRREGIARWLPEELRCEERNLTKANKPIQKVQVDGEIKNCMKIPRARAGTTPSQKKVSGKPESPLPSPIRLSSGKDGEPITRPISELLKPPSRAAPPPPPELQDPDAYALANSSPEIHAPNLHGVPTKTTMDISPICTPSSKSNAEWMADKFSEMLLIKDEIDGRKDSNLSNQDLENAPVKDKLADRRDMYRRKRAEAQAAAEQHIDPRGSNVTQYSDMNPHGSQVTNHSDMNPRGSQVTSRSGMNRPVQQEFILDGSPIVLPGPTDDSDDDLYSRPSQKKLRPKSPIVAPCVQAMESPSIAPPPYTKSEKMGDADPNPLSTKIRRKSSNKNLAVEKATKGVERNEKAAREADRTKRNQEVKQALQKHRKEMKNVQSKVKGMQNALKNQAGGGIDEILVYTPLDVERSRDKDHGHGNEADSSNGEDKGRVKQSAQNQLQRSNSRKVQSLGGASGQVPSSARTVKKEDTKVIQSAVQRQRMKRTEDAHLQLREKLRADKARKSKGKEIEVEIYLPPKGPRPQLSEFCNNSTSSSSSASPGHGVSEEEPSVHATPHRGTSSTPTTYHNLPSPPPPPQPTDIASDAYPPPFPSTPPNQRDLSSAPRGMTEDESGPYLSGRPSGGQHIWAMKDHLWIPQQAEGWDGLQSSGNGPENVFNDSFDSEGVGGEEESWARRRNSNPQAFWQQLSPVPEAQLQDLELTPRNQSIVALDSQDSPCPMPNPAPSPHPHMACLPHPQAGPNSARAQVNYQFGGENSQETSQQALSVKEPSIPFQHPEELDALLVGLQDDLLHSTAQGNAKSLKTIPPELRLKIRIEALKQLAENVLGMEQFAQLYRTLKVGTDAEKEKLNGAMQCNPILGSMVAHLKQLQLCEGLYYG